MNAVVGKGEVALWRAVIQQALNDAMPGARVHGSQPVLSAERRRHMHDARRWFAEAGRDFRIVCESALLEPLAVRAAATKRTAAFDQTCPSVPSTGRCARAAMVSAGEAAACA